MKKVGVAKNKEAYLRKLMSSDIQLLSLFFLLLAIAVFVAIGYLGDLLYFENTPSFFEDLNWAATWTTASLAGVLQIRRKEAPFGYKHPLRGKPAVIYGTIWFLTFLSIAAAQFIFD